MILTVLINGGIVPINQIQFCPPKTYFLVRYSLHQFSAANVLPTGTVRTQSSESENTPIQSHFSPNFKNLFNLTNQQFSAPKIMAFTFLLSSFNNMCYEWKHILYQTSNQIIWYISSYLNKWTACKWLKTLKRPKIYYIFGLNIHWNIKTSVCDKLNSLYTDVFIFSCCVCIES